MSNKNNIFNAKFLGHDFIKVINGNYKCKICGIIIWFGKLASYENIKYHIVRKSKLKFLESITLIDLKLTCEEYVIKNIIE